MEIKLFFEKTISKLAAIDISPRLIFYVALISITGFGLTFWDKTNYFFLFHNNLLDWIYVVFDPIIIFFISATLVFYLSSFLIIRKKTGLKVFVIRLVIAGILGLSVISSLVILENYILKPSFSYDRPQTQFEHQLTYSLFFRTNNSFNEKISPDTNWHQFPITKCAIEYYNEFSKSNPFEFIKNKTNIQNNKKKQLFQELDNISNRVGMYQISIPIKKNIEILEKLHSWKSKEIETWVSDKIEFISAEENGESCPSGFAMRQILILLIALLLVQKGNRDKIPIFKKTIIRNIFINFNIIAFLLIIFSRWYGYQHTMFDMSISFNSVVFFFFIIILIIESANSIVKSHRTRQLENIEKYINKFETFSAGDIILSKDKRIQENIYLANLLTQFILSHDIDRARVYMYRKIPKYTNNKRVDYEYLIASNFKDKKNIMSSDFLSYNILLKPRPTELEEVILKVIKNCKATNLILKNKHLEKVDKNLLGFEEGLRVYYFPLKSQNDETFGLISLDNKYSGKKLDVHVIESIETLCKHVVNHFNIQQQISLLNRQGDIYQGIIKGINMDKILKRVAEELCNSLNAECVSILILNPNTNKLELKHEWTYCEYSEGIPIEEELFEQTAIIKSSNNKGFKRIIEGQILTYNLFSSGKEKIINNLYQEYEGKFNEEIVDQWNSYLPSIKYGSEGKLNQVIFFPLFSMDSNKEKKGIIRVYNKKDRLYKKDNYTISKIGFSTNDLQIIQKLTLPLLLAIEMIQVNEEKIMFSHRISHNIHDPLSGIVSYLTRLNDIHGAEISDTIKKELKIIKLHADYLSSLVEMSKLFITGLNKEDIDDSELYFEKEMLSIVKMVSDYFNLTSKEDLIINKTIKNNKIKIKGLAELYRELIFVIFNNAIQYSKPGSKTIDISLMVDKNEDLIFVIRDYGIGIKNTDIKNIMKPLFRTEQSKKHDKKGMGIGLSVAQMIIKKYNLDLKFDSKMDEGTAVTIKIPNKNIISYEK